MGMLTYYAENLFNTDRKIIAHGVNCRGVFASGVAGQIAQQYPEVKRAYMRKHSREGWKPGMIQPVLTDDGHVIVNMATQSTYGRQGVHVKYDAIRECFAGLLDLAASSGQGVAIPKVGCGLGGGNWSVVESILLEELQTRNVDVDVYSVE